MKSITTRTLELKGSSYEIGQALGRMAASIPSMKNYYTSGYENFGEAEARQAETLFARWCPGLNEELSGFAGELNVPLESVVYYAMTGLHCRACSTGRLSARFWKTAVIPGRRSSF